MDRLDLVHALEKAAARLLLAAEQGDAREEGGAQSKEMRVLAARLQVMTSHLDTR